MKLEVVRLSVATPGQTQAWTFTANGAGFNNQAAQSMAEERLIKQISDDKKTSF